MNTMQERFPTQLNRKIDRKDGRGQGSKRFSCKHRRSFKHDSAVATEEFLLAFWSCLEGRGGGTMTKNNILENMALST